MTSTFNALSAVCFGPNHGYAFDGDVVHIDADVHVSGPDLACTLQLWAASDVPTAEQFEAACPGTCVAQSQHYLHSGQHHLSLNLDALMPAGSGDHAMFLVITTVDGDGKVRLLDLVSYSRREHFLLPRLAGTVSYRLMGDRVSLSAACIENPRSAGASSQQLVLELWATDEAYRGGYFRGYGLASAEVGRLMGQFGWTQCDYLVPLTPPPDGRYHLVAMLREWTSNGYRTRDYVNFDLPVDFPPAPEAAAGEATQVELSDDQETCHEQCAAQASVEVEVEAVAPPVAEVEAVAPPVAEAAPPAVEAAPAVVIEEAPVAVEVEAAPVVAAEPVAKREKAAKAEKPGKAAKAAATVSINHADASELAKVKGISKPVAAAIVIGRPYTSLDDLLQVKGIGAKALNKFKAFLSL